MIQEHQHHSGESSLGPLSPSEGPCPLKYPGYFSLFARLIVSVLLLSSEILLNLPYCRILINTFIAMILIWKREKLESC